MDFVKNYNDNDPISFEPIKNLNKERAFFLRCKNGGFYAYDAEAWLGWFCMHGTTHPETREEIQPCDVWQCFLVCNAFLPKTNQYIQKCLSLTLKASEKKEFIELVPTSCLLRLNVLEMRQTKKNKTLLVYNLSDSRKPQSIIGAKKLYLTLDYSKPIMVSF
jgi:hypothetical protein